MNSEPEGGHLQAKEVRVVGTAGERSLQEGSNDRLRAMLQRGLKFPDSIRLRNKWQIKNWGQKRQITCKEGKWDLG